MATRRPLRIMMVHAPSPLVREISRRGHTVLSCSPTQRPMTSEPAPATTGPPVRTIHFAGRKKVNLHAIRRIRYELRTFAPDVIHAFTPASLAWSVCASMGMRRKPKLVSFRGITRSLRRFDPSEWISYLSPRVAMHACESNAVMAAMLRSGVPEHRCRVVYNVPWDFDLDPSPDTWRSEWSVGDNEWLIGTVAHVRPVKGIDILLRALLPLCDLPHWRLVIMGNMDHDEVLRLAKRPEVENRVIFRGHCHNAPSAMRAFDVFVMPSRREGLCRALIEAMTLGICPVVSAAGGMKELVRDQEDGLVVPIEDEESLHQALRRLYHDRDLRKQYAASAMKRVRTLCTPDVMVDKLESIYHSLTPPQSKR